MTADGTSSSTVMSASASDRTVNTRAPAPVNASAMLSAIKGASSQMRIEQPAKLALYIGAIPARLSASARGAALLRGRLIPSRRSILKCATSVMIDYLKALVA
jgi:hypothetical protein